MTAQLGLFESPGPRVDLAFTSARRIALDAMSWVEHVPGWLAGHLALMDALAAAAIWEQRTRWMYTKEVAEPRLTAEYPELAEAPIPQLHAVGAALSRHYDVPYDRVWVNWYRDHRDSTAWHADRPYCKRAECIVPVLSLGETRRFMVRHRDGGPSKTLVVFGGDLVVMGGRCQRDWVHCVPKETQPRGMRISVNFASRVQAVPDEVPSAPAVGTDPATPFTDTSSDPGAWECPIVSLSP